MSTPLVLVEVWLLVQHIRFMPCLAKTVAVTFYQLHLSLQVAAATLSVNSQDLLMQARQRHLMVMDTISMATLILV